MAREPIRRGSESVPNDFSLPRDSWWAAAGKINDMTEELYALTSDTINAGAVEYDAPTVEASIALADAACVAQGKSILFIPASMLPYDITLCPPSAGVQRVREGGNAAAWDVLAYGAVGAEFPNLPTADSSASIQATIDTGHSVDFVGLSYLANNLTQNTNDQVFYSSSGQARIVKNANGTLFAGSGDRVQIRNIEFRGESSTPAFTGDNVVLMGNSCSMINCGSRWAYGRAVKATGGHIQIIGSQDIYQTADTSATGYDIEVGLSGTNTLYHELVGIYSSQHTGGILLTDTGSHTIHGGKFGKLTIKAGTLPVGHNGGKTIAARINGDVTVEMSGAVFVGNQFGPVAMTISSGLTGVHVDDSNNFDNGFTLISSGAGNNPLIRSIGTGGTIDIKYGDDNSLAILKVAAATGIFELPRELVMPNARNIYFRNAANGLSANLSQGSNNYVAFTNPETGKGFQFTATGASGTHQFFANGAESGRFDANATAGNTRFMIYDVDNGTLERVTVGAADSGGVGFKVLRIPN